MARQTDSLDQLSGALYAVRCTGAPAVRKERDFDDPDVDSIPFLDSKFPAIGHMAPLPGEVSDAPVSPEISGRRGRRVP